MAGERNNDVVAWNEQQNPTTVNELEELRRENEELRRKNAESEQKNTELQQKNTELQQKNTELEQKNAESEQKNVELEQKNAELQRKLDEARWELDQLRGNVVNSQQEGNNVGWEQAPDLVESDITEQLHGRNWRLVITKPEVVEAVNALEWNYKKEVSDFIKSGDIKGLQKYLNEKIETWHIDKEKLKASLKEKWIPFEWHIKEDWYLGPQTLETIKNIIKEWTPEQGTWTPEQGTWTPEQGTWTPEQGTWTPEQGTWTPEHQPINFNNLWEFDVNKDFSFRAWLTQEDWDKNFINVSWERYDEYTNDITWKWYQRWRYEDNGDVIGWIYLWDFINWKSEWYGVITSSNWEKYEWEWKNDMKEWQWTFTRKNWDVYTWEWKNDVMEWEWVLTHANWNKFEWRYMRNEMISWEYRINIEDEEKVYEVRRENGIMKIVSWPDNIGKYINQKKWGWEIVDNPESINLDDLWRFEDDNNNDYNFIFNEDPQEDEDGNKYVEVLWERYYEYADNITWKCYKVEEANNDDWIWYTWIYIWNYENGQKQWEWTKIWGNWVRYVWDWNNDKANWRWIFYNREMRTYEWEWKDNVKEWYWIETLGDWTRYEWEWKNDMKEWQWIMFDVNWNKYEWEFIESKVSKWKYTVVKPDGIAWEYEVENDDKWQKITSWPEWSVGKYIISSFGSEEWEIVDSIE